MDIGSGGRGLGRGLGGGGGAVAAVIQKMQQNYRFEYQNKIIWLLQYEDGKF